MDNNFIVLDRYGSIKYKNRYNVSKIYFYDNDNLIDIDELNVIDDNSNNIDFLYLKLYFDENIIYSNKSSINKNFLQNKDKIYVLKYDKNNNNLIYDYPSLFIPLQKYKLDLISEENALIGNYDTSIIKKYYFNIKIDATVRYKNNNITVNYNNMLLTSKQNKKLTAKGKKLTVLKNILDNANYNFLFEPSSTIRLEHIDMILSCMSDKNFSKLFNELLRSQKLNEILNEK